jgi:hypothetical protein
MDIDSVFTIFESSVKRRETKNGLGREDSGRQFEEFEETGR